MGGKLQERSQRRQARIAAAHRIVPRLLQMIEKAEDQLRVEIGQGEDGRCLADLGFGEPQQQTEGVPVCGDGTRTDGSVLSQMFDEKPLKQRWEGGRLNRFSHDDRPAPGGEQLKPFPRDRHQIRHASQVPVGVRHFGMAT